MQKPGLDITVSKRIGSYDVFVSSARSGHLRSDTFRLAVRQDGAGAEGLLAAKTYDTGADKLSRDRLSNGSFRAAESNNRSTDAVRGD